MNHHHFVEIKLQKSRKAEKLYYIGDHTKAFDPKMNISIVGSRKASPYGKFLVEELVKYLACFEVNIVSGLADGIDSLAHEYALKHQLNTIAVLGAGLSRLEYLNPRQEKLLAGIREDEQNLIISQFEPEHPANNWTFPQRNQVIAALSQAVIVIEASLKSGSLITAKCASVLKVPVFTFPGEIWKENFKGNNYLINSKKAIALHQIQDLGEYLPDLKAREQKTNQETSLQVSLLEQKILDHLSQEPLSLDEIIAITNSNTSELLTRLTMLELKGLVRKYAGMRFAKTP
jgi:DNA processing protein